MIAAPKLNKGIPVGTRSMTFAMAAIGNVALQYSQINRRIALTLVAHTFSAQQLVHSSGLMRHGETALGVYPLIALGAGTDKQGARCRQSQQLMRVGRQIAFS